MDTVQSAMVIDRAHGVASPSWQFPLRSQHADLNEIRLDDNKVGVTFIDPPVYPHTPPFDPPEAYPEYRGAAVDSTNHVYAGVRNTLRMLDLDATNFGTSSWNPFGSLIKPGMTVFIKPNTVRHSHLAGGNVLAIINHASVIRPILDYVLIALNGDGRIIIGDSQVTEGQFDRALVASQLDVLLDWYRTQTKVPIECFDLRINRAVRTWLYGKWGRKEIRKDPRGYRFVDLGNLSYFRDVDPAKLRIAIASYKVMREHHANGKHEYLFPNSVLESDVIINIAKLKTHRRTAVTLALKNFMGLPALKDTLPHFTIGSPEEGGDQYIHPSWRKRVCTRLHDQIQTRRWLPVKCACAVVKKALWNSHKIVPFKDDIYEAMWYGNDTVWRTLLDLNRAALYADKQGTIRDTQQRGLFCLIDGIIGGEKDGPLSPDPVSSGALLAGSNPVVVDCIASSLMGFDITRIPLVMNAIRDKSHANPLYFSEPDEIVVIENDTALYFDEFLSRRNLKFEPHPTWKGHVERVEVQT